jgi:predicted DNA binding protein
MPPGIRATVTFPSPSNCPVAEFSRDTATTIDSVATNVCPAGCEHSVTEFAVDVDPEFEADIEPTFSHGTTRRYRVTHDAEAGCPCVVLGKLGCPIARFVATEGSLTLVFHAVGYDELRDVIDDLLEQFSDVNVKRFVQSPIEGEHSHDRVLVDRSRLTARQLDVLETAQTMGYFERPRQANATDVATELDVSLSTFSEHLAAAERKILEDFL